MRRQRIGQKLKELGDKTLTNENFSKAQLVIQLVILIFLIYTRQFVYLFGKENSEFSEKAPLKKACTLAMKSLLNKKASPHLFAPTLISQIVESDYQVFDFMGNEKIFDVIGKSKNHCIVVFRDRKGTRFFSFYFKESKKKKHFYGKFIERIDEPALETLTEEIP